MTLRRRAFTILELLIAVGIIFLLASLIIVALGGVRAAANRADSISALRQMTMAYNGYSTDNDQRLMPGYVSAGRQTQLGIRAKLETGTYLAAGGDVESYVWRLSPYLSNEWRTMFIDYRNERLEGRLTAELGGKLRDVGDGVTFSESPPVYGPESAVFPSDIGISRAPSFGLNSIFVGGDDVHGGPAIAARNPWDDPGNALAATRYAEVKNPARLVVFAPSRAVSPPVADPAGEVVIGSPELRPPMLDWQRTGGVLEPIDPQWKVDFDLPEDSYNIDATIGVYDEGGGVPISRWGGNEVPTGHLDGSVTTQSLLDLESDLRKWSPFVIGN